MLASCPASMLNQISLKLGIPFDSFLSHPALETDLRETQGYHHRRYTAASAAREDRLSRY
jgi:hypothetical protein